MLAVGFTLSMPPLSGLPKYIIMGSHKELPSIGTGHGRDHNIQVRSIILDHWAIIILVHNSELKHNPHMHLQIIGKEYRCFLFKVF